MNKLLTTFQAPSPLLPLCYRTFSVFYDFSMDVALKNYHFSFIGYKNHLPFEAHFRTNLQEKFKNGERQFFKIKRIGLPVGFSENSARITDNGGTRTGEDRRQNPIKNYTSDRRSGRDRRGGSDRRKVQQVRGKKAIERRESFR
jgi:hypothetical protein